jgi:Predicted solute binding protein
MRKLLPVVSLLIVVSMLLAACQATATPTAAPTAAATTAATPATTRHGGWLDEIVFSVVSGDSAVTQLKAGAIDIYANALASKDLQTIKDAGLSYSPASGLYYDILYNPAVFTDKNTLNPFSDKKIREATNWLYDRNYLNQEVFGGGSLPKWFTIQTNGPDYADLADVARGLENAYAFNFDKANTTIAAEMKTLGATQDASGKWQYNGKPVTLNFIIRNDGDGTRLPIGDYVAGQLEKVGFTVNREYKKSSEASPIWIGSDPVAGEWNLYTAAWSQTVIERDARADFQQMYLPDSIQGMSVFIDNNPDPEFQKVGDALVNSTYKDATERHNLMAEALKLSLQDSLQVFLIDGLSYTPYTNNVQVTADMSAGVESGQIFPVTMRFKGQEGGTLKWGDQDLFGDPYNPIGGSNWTYDQAAIRTTMSFATMNDPFTGLTWPWRLDKADLTISKDIQVVNNLNWVNMTAATDTIVPPDDAWIDWDAKAQKFETVADAKAAKTVVDGFTTALTTAASTFDFKGISDATLTKFVTDQAAAYATAANTAIDTKTYLANKDNVAAIGDEVKAIKAITDATKQPDELVTYVKNLVGGLDTTNTFELGTKDLSSAKTVSKVYYPANLYDTVVWQDGSHMSAGDFVMAMIMAFDRAKTESAIYDESAVPNFQSFMQGFKGVKIDSVNPLVIETWSDVYSADAELDLSTWWPSEPTYAYGEAGWDILAVANLAEANGELAYTADKATAKSIDQTNFVSGDSLKVLAKYLDQAATEKYVPYAATLGQYVTADEAATRYANMQAWYKAHNHFWVGTGPYYLDTVSPVEKSLVLKSYSGYADLADRWSDKFSEPMIPVVDITAPDSVTIGKDATFKVDVSFNGQPYPQTDVKMVKYLVYDATGAVIKSDVATAVADGQYTVTLPADVTSKLAAGSNKLEVAVVPLPVAAPTFASVQFVTAQ